MKTLQRLLTMLLPLRWQVLLAILLGCIMVASNIALLSMAAYLIAAAAIVPLLLFLTVPIAIVQFMGVVRPVSRYYERLVSHNVTFRLLARLRVWVYQHLEPLAPGHLLTYRSGDMLSRLVADVDELQHLYLRVVAPFVVAIVMCVLTWCIFSIFSPLLAWVAVIFLLCAGLGVPLFVSRLTLGLGKQQLAIRAAQKDCIVEGVQGIQDLLAYGQAGQQCYKLSLLDASLGKLERRLAMLTGLQDALHDLLTHLALWTLLILAISLVTTHAINSVYLGFLALLILASFEAIQPLAQALPMLGHSLAAGQRMFAITDAQPSVTDPIAPIDLPTAQDGYSLAFDHLDFSYGVQENAVLHDICLQLAPGSHVALVGPSGSGKSTLARLAVRCWDPSHGSLRLNGQDIRDYRLSELRSLIGVVAQDTYLFNDTLRNNLRLARSTASEDELQAVLAQAQLDEFVRSLPRGLDTWIGEQGVRLSGGERQRLAIARALLKDAPILLLDEVTANLDPLTECALLNALDALMQGRTTLFITHRLIAMERMDEIIVLDQGRIVERGTHSQLLAADGLYHQLFDLQDTIVTFSEV
jgi:ATP-binding cassette, subfamily C, bacterial CydC